MVLFPKIDAQFYTSQSSEDKSIKEMMEHSYSNSITINQSFWQEADIDSRFKDGDQSIWNEVYGQHQNNNRKSFSFNRILRICNMITGYQRRNRKSTVAIPIENSDQVTADQFSKILLWSMNKDDTLETISQAFDGALTTGMNLLSVWMDYRNDPISGDIR